ncbi:MAG TPA: AsnC family transcriptional regulator, partial [Lachnospiraceae bacterium]|nr:AsnC family transcriptional regulator [Lachnospiraceae bacterium]
MREEILTMIEKNNKLSTKDLADMFGVDEVTIINEIAKMEEEKVICG